MIRRPPISTRPATLCPCASLFRSRRPGGLEQAKRAAGERHALVRLAEQIVADAKIAAGAADRQRGQPGLAIAARRAKPPMRFGPNRSERAKEPARVADHHDDPRRERKRAVKGMWEYGREQRGSKP